MVLINPLFIYIIIIPGELMFIIAEPIQKYITLRKKPVIVIGKNIWMLPPMGKHQFEKI